MPKYSKVIFGDHCKERQNERGISNQQILKVIQDYDIELPQKRKNRRRFIKRIDGTNLTVVVKERKNAKEALVITTFWNS